MIFTPLLPVIPYAVFVVLILALCAWVYLKSRTNRQISTTTWARRGVAVALVLFMGFGPATLEPTTEAVRINTDVFLVVDRTGSMAAEDYVDKTTRLTGVRADINTLTDELGGGRFSVLSFDSSANRQLPLTTDTAAVKTWADGLSQELTVYSAGSNMNRALSELRILLQRGRAENPFNQQIVFFFTDGENTSEEPRQSFSDLATYIDGGAVLGYGTEKGAKMKRYDPLLNDDQYIKDYSGKSPKDAISRIDEADLKALANEVGITYIHRSEPGSLAEVSQDLETNLVSAEGSRAIEVPQLLLWPFASVIAVLLIWELCARMRRLTAEVG